MSYNINIVKNDPPAGKKLPTSLKRRRPRSFIEWKTLKAWEQLPAWEAEPAGYLLRLVREDEGLSQQEMAKRLGCSQQAVAQAERFASNPTIGFVRAWARAVERRLEVVLVREG
jgi:DNA-binding XRE family transcriptional regulator